MADPINRPSTHYSSLESNIRVLTTAPAEPLGGDTYYDSSNNKLCIYNDTLAAWKCKSFSTTTSTSTSTTSTSTSTSTTSTSSSTTSTSSSTSTSTTTSTSTSTTTTL